MDWPRHWRNTRRSTAAEVVSAMNTSREHARYYEDTVRTIEYSKQFATQFEGRGDADERMLYPEFSYKNERLELPARAVRLVPGEALKADP